VLSATRAEAAHAVSMGAGTLRCLSLRWLHAAACAVQEQLGLSGGSHQPSKLSPQMGKGWSCSGSTA